jgi:hypothetical protein
MDGALKSKILELLNQHRLMTIATNRPDGWPQATTVGYVNAAGFLHLRAREAGFFGAQDGRASK